MSSCTVHLLSFGAKNDPTWFHCYSKHTVKTIPSTLCHTFNPTSVQPITMILPVFLEFRVNRRWLKIGKSVFWRQRILFGLKTTQENKRAQGENLRINKESCHGWSWLLQVIKSHMCNLKTSHRSFNGAWLSSETVRSCHHNKEACFIYHHINSPDTSLMNKNTKKKPQDLFFSTTCKNT